MTAADWAVLAGVAVVAWFVYEKNTSTTNQAAPPPGSNGGSGTDPNRTTFNTALTDVGTGNLPGAGAAIFKNIAGFLTNPNSYKTGNAGPAVISNYCRNTPTFSGRIPGGGGSCNHGVYTPEVVNPPSSITVAGITVNLTPGSTVKTSTIPPPSAATFTAGQQLTAALKARGVI